MKVFYTTLTAILLGWQVNAQVITDVGNYAEAGLTDADLLNIKEVVPDGYDGITTSDIHDELSETQRTEIWANIHANTLMLKEAGIIPASPEVELMIPGDGFRHPLKLTVGDFVYNWGAFYWNSNFVDENPAAGAVLDYNCGTRTYDVPGYNHQGQDIALWPFAWNLVAGNYASVVAAQGGWITFKQDGNFDMNCGFGGGDWNAVYLTHTDGSVTWYGHMKNGSLTAKPVGAWVAKGEYLGIVASSGQSTGPHLHFEVYDALGNLVDPNAGPCNAMGGMNWWKDPKPYYFSEINALYTHCAPPAFMPCPNLDVTNICSVFYPGNLVYFFSYFKETLAGQKMKFQIFTPSGTLYQNWTYSFPVSYLASYWYWSYFLPPGNLGTWTFKVTFKGKTLSYFFNVINPLTDGGGTGERMGSTNRIYWMNDASLIDATFEVERSTGKINTEVIGTLDGVALMEKTVYELYDAAPSFGTNYYRIKTNHSNGQVIYSAWIELNNTREDDAVSFTDMIYPSPATNELNVVTKAPVNMDMHITIYDATGQVVNTQNHTSDLENLVRMDVSTLTAGIYFIEIESVLGRSVQKFVKE